MRCWINQTLAADTALICVFPVNGHWAPAVAWIDCHGLQVRILGTALMLITHRVMLSFFEACSQICGCPLTLQRQHRLFCETNCGAFATIITFLRYIWFGEALPEIHDHVLMVQQVLQEKSQDTCLKPWQWNAGTVDPAAQGLIPILTQQGVRNDQKDGRARAAVRAIGSGPVLNAVSSKTPWRQLKSLRNNVKFQFLLPSELDARIAKQAGQGPVGRSKGVKSSRKSYADTAPIEIDHNKLVIAPGTFQCQGQPLNQISLTNLGPLPEHVALAVLLICEPYLFTLGQ